MYYSLRDKSLRKKNIKKTLIFLISSLLVTVVCLILGIKILVAVINFISETKSSNKVSVSKDNIPPKTPEVYSYNKTTSKSSFDIKGNAEPSSQVILKFNRKEIQTVSDNNGIFLFNIELSEGSNLFSIYSKDSSGNTSQTSIDYHVTFDTTPPAIDIKTPSNNSTFKGISQKNLEIKGTTEQDATLSINDRYISLDDGGNFIYKYVLQSGENKFTFKAVDPAGNEEIKEFSVSFEE